MLDWEWYTDINVCRLFTHMLLKANHKDRNWRGILIKRGQTLTSLNTLESETGLSKSQIRTAIKKLISTQEIAQQSHSQHTVFTIKNYDSYQVDDTQNGKPVTHESHTNDTRMTSNKNDKNENNDKEENINSAKQGLPPCPQQEILKVWKEVMPDKTQPRTWDGQRSQNLKARWNSGFSIERNDGNGFLYTDTESGINFWRAFFHFMRKSQFLMNDCRPFGLDWIVKKANFEKILEHKYHG